MIRRAQDGLRARVSGPWTREKLDYVGRYATAFMKAMNPKRRAGIWSELVYVDLLAGPGRGIDRDGNAEFDGSPLRALEIEPAFDRLFFSDLDKRNVEALRQRISPDHQRRVTLRVGDCNVVVKDVMASLTRGTLGLAFVDPEGFEAKFDVLEALARRRIDVLFLFPSGIGIARNLRAFARQAHSPMDDLWGGREWRELPPAKLAAGERITSEEALSFDRPWVLAETRLRSTRFPFYTAGSHNPVSDGRCRVLCAEHNGAAGDAAGDDSDSADDHPPGLPAPESPPRGAWPGAAVGEALVLDVATVAAAGEGVEVVRPADPPGREEMKRLLEGG